MAPSSNQNRRIPRWVKVAGLVALLALALVIAHLVTGGYRQHVHGAQAEPAGATHP